MEKMGKRLFLIVVLVAVLSGCRTIQQTTDQYHQKDSVRVEYVTKLDSIYLYEKDSIWIKEKGDTIFVDKWHLRYKDKIVEVRDSIYIDRLQIDSISVAMEVPVRYVPKFYKGCTWAFWIILVLVLLWIVWKLFKKFYLRK